MHFENDDQFFQYLLEKGAMEPYGVNDDGEPLYRFNLDILEEVLPEAAEVIKEEIDNDLMHLYEMGLIDISYNENLDVTFSVSEKGKKYIETGEIESFTRDNG
jgi:rRNA pseudouridine-1189 N-methylase Emg1 (Nep1/Mra1 family)